jgi:hypothetical protein
MTSNKTKKIIIALIVIASLQTIIIGVLLLGSVGGLVYGWVINPVTCIDVSPNLLRSDYQDSYVKLVVDSYLLNGDLESASFYLGSWEIDEVTQLLSQQLVEAIGEEDIKRASAIREIIETVND